MKDALRVLDDILRGQATRPEKIDDGAIEIPLQGLALVIIGLAMSYGLCMGSYSIFRQFDPSIGPSSDRWMQLLASTIKVPALFLLTLCVTFPSLYVFNALVGSRLRWTAILKLLVASLAVNIAVLASLGPITAFFSVSTTSYHFMLLFNVVVFAVSGALGLMFLRQTLNRMSAPSELDTREQRIRRFLDRVKTPEASDDASIAEAEIVIQVDESSTRAQGALEPTIPHVLSGHVRLVFRIWIVVFGFVGAQMSWVLRPFIGDPGRPFAWFRDRESNFFEAILAVVGELITWN